MAVIVSKSDGNLSTADNWYVSYGASMCLTDDVGTGYYTISNTIYSGRWLNFTENHNCLGFVVGLTTASQTSVDRSIRFMLCEANPVTLTIASPGIVNWTGHTFTGDEEITFLNTGGALPTNATAFNRFYVKYIDANRFYVSTTIGGANVNFTGTQSGTQYVGRFRAEKTLTANELHCGKTLSTYKTVGSYIHDIEFPSSYAVTTDANKWLLLATTLDQSGSTGTWYFRKDNSQSLSYVSFSDTTTGFTNNDTIVVRNYIDIDQSFTTNTTIGSVHSANTYFIPSGWVCSNKNDITITGVSFLTCLNPASAYTWTCKGCIYTDGNSGIRIGTEASPISRDKKFTIDITTEPSGATVVQYNRIWIKHVTGTASNTYLYYNGRQNLFLYGEPPTNQYVSLSGDTLAGTCTIDVDGDYSIDWSVDDNISIGKQDVIGQGDTQLYSILKYGYKDISPVMTSLNTPSPYVVSASHTYTTYYAYQAFDATVTNTWLAQRTTTSWLKINLSSATVANAVLLSVPVIARAPKNFTIEGSTNDSDWDVLDTQVNYSGFSLSYASLFEFTNLSAYTYYRINITSNNGDSTYTGIANFRLLQSTDNKSILLNKCVNLYNRFSGSEVCQLSNYGIKVIGLNTAYSLLYTLTSPSNIQMYGCSFKNIITSTAIYSKWDDDYLEQPFFKKSSTYTEYDTTLVGYIGLTTPRLGCLYEDIVSFRGFPVIEPITTSYYASSVYKSGLYKIKNLICNQPLLRNFGSSLAYVRQHFENIKVYNGYASATAYYPLFRLCGKELHFKDIYVYGWKSLTTYPGSAVIEFYGVLLNSDDISNIRIDRCDKAIDINSTCIIDNVNMSTITLGETVANTLDIGIESGAYPKITFENMVGDLVNDITYQTEMTVGSEIRFTNFNNVTNDDRILTPFGDYQRCSTGLTDETYHYNVEGYSTRRFSVNNSDISTKLEQDITIPTGNVKNLIMTITCYVKINSANYWASGTTYEMPRITIEYDDGLYETYVECEKNTDWQLLCVNFTTTTEYGQVNMKLSTSTDAIGSDGYVYFAEKSVLYPAGYKLDLGNSYLYSDASPVNPPIATVINAADVWNVQQSAINYVGTMAGQLNKIDITTTNNQALIIMKK